MDFYKARVKKNIRRAITAIPIPHPVPVEIPQKIEIPIPQPQKIPVEIPHPFPVEVVKHVEVPIEKPEPVIVEKHVSNWKKLVELSKERGVKHALKIKKKKKELITKSYITCNFVGFPGTFCGGEAVSSLRRKEISHSSRQAVSSSRASL